MAALTASYDTRTETDGQGHTYAGKASWYVYDGLGSVVGEVDLLGDLTCSMEWTQLVYLL